MQTLGERLKWLFENIRKPDGTEFSLQDVETATEGLGHRVTTSTLHKLRHDQVKNPGFFTMRSVATFFKVPVSFFYDDLSTEEIEHFKLSAMPSTVHEIAYRANEMTEAERNILLGMLNMVGNLSDTLRQRAPKSKE